MNLQAGTRLGPYEIESMIGAGGMGEVYRARDVRLGRPVALKLLPDRALGSGPAVERFLQEARTASALNHPNICTVYDVGEQEGRHFLVLELLEGETLERKLAAGPLPIAPLRALADQVADALQTAHASGILHRDIKPSNIFVTSRGQAKVLDFGLAKLTEQRVAARGSPEGAGIAGAGAELTVPGTSLGTLGYMSPEQALGKPVDERTDVFALGAVLYEMATGRKAFPGDTAAAIFDAILHQTPPPADLLNRDISPELTRVLDRALAKDAASRHPDMAALRDDLRASSRPGPARGGNGSPSIAVLPFANLSADPENEYFTDGMAEEIITALCKVEALRVASRTSSFAFKGKNEDIRAIGRTLGVSTILEGSVRKSGQRLRVTAQLIKVDDGYHLWSERFDRNLEDVFALQDEIAESIASALRVVLSSREKSAIKKVPTKSTEAYDFYLRGRAYLHTVRREGWRLAEQMFRKAVAIDPDFALAWAAISETYMWIYTWFTPTPEISQVIDESSLRALAIDPELAEAHVARGLAASLHKDHGLAGQEFETAARLNPRLWDAYYFHGRICMTEGQIEKAAALFAKASEVRPDDYEAPALRVSCLAGLDRPEERRAVAARAIRITEKHLELHPDDARATYFGAGHWVALGDFEKAQEWAARAMAMAPEEPSVRYNVACFYAQMGRLEEALDLIEKNVTALGWGNAQWLRNDPDMANLQAHPRFRGLLERIEARQVDARPGGTG